MFNARMLDAVSALSHYFFLFLYLFTYIYAPIWTNEIANITKYARKTHPERFPFINIYRTYGRVKNGPLRKNNLFLTKKKQQQNPRATKHEGGGGGLRP